MFAITTKQLLPKLVAPVCASSATNLQQVRYRKPFFTPDFGYTNLTMGPYPRTKEERERAAKKYNLIPEDYEPYDEDEGWGDYPKLKAVGAFNRDRYDDFDDPVDNRYYGEPLHLDYDLYQWERYDPLEHEKKGLPPTWIKAAFFFGCPILLYAYFAFMEHFRLNINHPWKMRRAAPDQPLYEFPPSEVKAIRHHH